MTTFQHFKFEGELLQLWTDYDDDGQAEISDIVTSYIRAMYLGRGSTAISINIGNEVVGKIVCKDRAMAVSVYEGLRGRLKEGLW